MGQWAWELLAQACLSHGLPHHPGSWPPPRCTLRTPALEEEIDRNKDHPALPLVLPHGANQEEGADQDMETLWRALGGAGAVPEATRKYVERIHEVGQNEPELLVAHAPTPAKHGGTSSGGQVLKLG